MRMLSKYNITRPEMLWLFAVAVWLITLLFASCRKKELDVQQNFPFEVKVMPFREDIVAGQTVELRCSIIASGDFKGTNYFIRYFQFDGEGTLRYYSDPPYIPNDRYLLPQKDFRLYYTSLSGTAQSFTVWIYDSFGNEQAVNFQFKNGE